MTEPMPIPADHTHHQQLHRWGIISALTLSFTLGLAWWAWHTQQTLQHQITQSQQQLTDAFRHYRFMQQQKNMHQTYALPFDSLNQHTTLIFNEHNRLQWTDKLLAAHKPLHITDFTFTFQPNSPFQFQAQHASHNNPITQLTITPLEWMGNFQHEQDLFTLTDALTQHMHPLTHLNQCDLRRLDKNLSPFTLNRIGNLQIHCRFGLLQIQPSKAQP